MSPGGYLRDMREADGKSIHDVAQILRMLKLCGMGRIWPSAGSLEKRLDRIESDDVIANPDQLRSLTLAYPFRLAVYRDRCAALERSMHG